MGERGGRGDVDFGLESPTARLFLVRAAGVGEADSSLSFNHLDGDVEVGRLSVAAVEYLDDRLKVGGAAKPCVGEVEGFVGSAGTAARWRKARVGVLVVFDVGSVALFSSFFLFASSSELSAAELKSAGALFFSTISPGVKLGKTLTAFGDKSSRFFPSLWSSIAALVSLSIASLKAGTATSVPFC